MANKQTAILNRRQAQGDDDSFNLSEILQKFLSNWKLFCIFFVVSFAGAFAYSKIIKPVFEIRATMLMHDDSKDSKASEEQAALQALNLVNPTKIVENEVEVLQSRSLVHKVVDNLQLWTSYKYKEGLVSTDLYNVTPVKFIAFTKPAIGTNKTLNIKILGAGSFMLLDDNGQGNEYFFKDTVKDVIGKWKLAPTNNVEEYTGKTIQISVTDAEAATTAFQAPLTVEVKDKLASVVDLAITDKNIKRGEDFLNTLIYLYNQAELAEKNNLTKSTLKFIDKRLDSLRGELGHAESGLSSFRSSRGITDVNAQSTAMIQNSQNNDSKLNDVNIQLKVVEGLENYVNSGNDRQSAPSTAGITDPTLSSLVQKLTELQLERVKLLATTPEKNPVFDPINEQIATTKAALADNIRGIKNSLLSQKRELSSQRTTTQNNLSAVPAEQQQLNSLTRQTTVKENLYNYLLEKREQVSLSYASSLSNARLIDVAYAVPLKATKKIIPFGVAFFMGLFIPIGIIFSKEAIKNTVNKRREIQTATGLPVLAEISYLKLKSEIVTSPDNNGEGFALVEQFRHLRTQLNLLNTIDGAGKITLVTSSVTGEGKSFISTNLALSLSKSGKKTILIELDNYKPRVSKIFGITALRGLSDFLRGNSSKQEIIQPLQAYSNLSLISTGAYIDDFAELIEQAPFQDMIIGLKQEYDHILIDCPPVHSINDANIVAKLADTTLYLVRHNYTSKSLLPFIQKLNIEEMLPQMQVVFNGLREGRDGEGYKYEQYYQAKKDIA